MSIIIRKMQKEDKVIWADMRFKLWDRLFLDEHVGDIERMLKSKKRSGYIAVRAGNQPIGFAEICIREYANGCTEQPVAFLVGVWVDPKHRRQVRSALIEKIAEVFHELCSDAGIKNRRSHQAHRKWGFHETDRVVYFLKPLA